MGRPPLLSIVLPVYNVAPFLAQCLDSLIKEPAGEIIAVDDGSTDECPQILQDYAGRDARIRIIRQENAGLSAARNTGMAAAQGKYLAFVDSDDFVEEGMYSRLLEIAERDGLDIALGNGYFHFSGNKLDTPIYREGPPQEITSGREWLREMLRQQKLLHMVWLHLYRRGFLTGNGFSFEPGLVHEDVIWTTRALLRAGRVRYDPTPGYRYRIRERHFTPEQDSRRLSAIIKSSVRNAEALAMMASAESADREMMQLLRWQLVDGGLSVFHKLEKIPDAAERRRQFSWLRERGYFRLLWDKAVLFRQKRRVLRHFLKNFFAA